MAPETAAGTPVGKRAGWAELLVCLIVCYATATVGAIASVTAPEFYRQLVQPAWAPPGWLFGPVWTLLYTLMAISAWLVWRAGSLIGARRSFLWFIAQLLCNALWSWLFFAWRRGGLAMADIIVLWLLLLGTVLSFRRWSRLSAWLLAPYLAWVTFAAALNLAVWQANPGLLH